MYKIFQEIVVIVYSNYIILKLIILSKTTQDIAFYFF